METFAFCYFLLVLSMFKNSFQAWRSIAIGTSCKNSFFAQRTNILDCSAICRYENYHMFMLVLAVFIKIHPFAWTWHVITSRIEPQRKEIKQWCVMLGIAAGGSFHQKSTGNLGLWMRDQVLKIYEYQCQNVETFSLIVSEWCIKICLSSKSSILMKIFLKSW